MGKVFEMGRPQTDIEETLDQAADALEVITNLNYLISGDADRPDAVREYSDESQVAIYRLAQSLRELAFARKSLASAA